INPEYSHPIGMRKFPKFNEILFAGSWMPRYPDRLKDTRMLFDGVIESGRELKIIDRNFERNNSRYFFPEKYVKYLSPSLDHEDLQKLHKLYNWSINLSSVQNSNTMFPHRIYELQVLGN